LNTVIQKDILEKINFGKVSRYALYLIVVLILQNILFTQMRLLGVCPLVLPAVAVAMGMFEGATWGAVFSLVMGIFADMAFIENTIFFTLLFPALSFLAGFVSNYYINRRFFAYMGAAAGGLLITAAAQILKTSAMDTFSPVMITTGLLQTLWSLPFAALVYYPPSRLSRLE
jgi:cell shape-determining protein MreD